MPDSVLIGGQEVWLSDQQVVPEKTIVGRREELALCGAAMGVNNQGRFDDSLQPLHFRLEGAPGVGKNEIVYEMARRLAKTEKLPFYSVQGHEEMTPEDLSLLVVPNPNEQGLAMQLRASPLATALFEGGFFFFDEINRVPSRALSPLASVLDDRRSMYSATTGITIEPKNENARKRFRFCCALNPSLGRAGEGVLPDYIEERTLPAIQIDYLAGPELTELVRQHVRSDQKLLEGFGAWYEKRNRKELSARQAIALARWAVQTLRPTESPLEAFTRGEKNILRPEQR